MKITANSLIKMGACTDGIKQFQEKFGKQAELKDVIQYCIKKKEPILLQYANWLIIRKMKHNQQIQYAIFAAKQVLYIFEKKIPEG